MSNPSRRLGKAVDEVRKTFEKTVSKTLENSSESLVKASKTASQGLGKTLASFFGENDPMVYVCIVLILVYVAIAKPSNTPGFFRNPIVKVLVVALVAYVAHQNLLLGIIFGLSMVLTIAYAHQNSIDGFTEDENQPPMVQQQQPEIQSFTGGSPSSPNVMDNLKQHFQEGGSMNNADAQRLLAEAQKQMNNVIGQLTQVSAGSTTQQPFYSSFPESFDNQGSVQQQQPIYAHESFDNQAPVQQPLYSNESFDNQAPVQQPIYTHESFCGGSSCEEKQVLQQVTPGVPSSNVSSIQAFSGTTGLQSSPFEGI